MSWERKTTRYCSVFPLHYRSNSETHTRNLLGISNFSIDSSSMATAASYLNMSYTVSAYYLQNGKENSVSFAPPPPVDGKAHKWELRSQVSLSCHLTIFYVRVHSSASIFYTSLYAYLYVCLCACVHVRVCMCVCDCVFM